MSELLISYDAKPNLERNYIPPSSGHQELGLQQYDENRAT